MNFSFNYRVNVKIHIDSLTRESQSSVLAETELHCCLLEMSEKLLLLKPLQCLEDVTCSLM